MLVQIGVVNAHPPLVVVLLSNQNGIYKPFWVEDLFDEPSRKEF
jgi:hypothetical protein